MYFVKALIAKSFAMRFALLCAVLLLSSVQVAYAQKSTSFPIIVNGVNYGTVTATSYAAEG